MDGMMPYGHQEADASRIKPDIMAGNTDSRAYEVMGKGAHATAAAMIFRMPMSNDGLQHWDGIDASTTQPQGTTGWANGTPGRTGKPDASAKGTVMRSRTLAHGSRCLWRRYEKDHLL